VLALTKIFPNALQPFAAPYFRQQFAALGELCDLEVFGLIPWYPGAGLLKRWSRIGQLTAVPLRENIAGLAVAHPRVVQPPRVGYGLAAAGYVASLLGPVAARRSRLDALFATWAYPDGAAACALGALLRIPVVVQVIGSDINVEARKPAARRNLVTLLPRAQRVVAVSRQLGDEVADLGVARDRIRVIVTGIDKTLFHLRDRAAARRALGRRSDERILLYVGRLERDKGLFDLLDAFARIAPDHPETTLVILGAGSAGHEIAARAAELGGRVALLGEQPLEAIPEWMAASDVVTLPSWAEGTPNVLIEALACGRPVVATNVGGIPDLVREPLQGELVSPRNVTALAEALTRVANAPHDPGLIAASNPHGDWHDNATRVMQAIDEAIVMGSEPSRTIYDASAESERYNT
jgi:glycosyltransferase involved in cell wall biosynthesis